MALLNDLIEILLIMEAFVLFGLCKGAIKNKNSKSLLDAYMFVEYNDVLMLKR